MNDEQRPKTCSFCRKAQAEVRHLIAGPGAQICDSCVQLCADLLDDTSPEPGAKRDILSDLPTPLEIVQALNEYVVGQTQTKKVLAVAVHNHYQRLKLLNEPDDDDVVGVTGFDITAAVVVSGVVGRPPSAVTAPLVASVRSTRRPSCET